MADETRQVEQAASLGSAQRALAVFDRLDYPHERVRIVVNRWSKKSLNLDWEQIERFLSKRPVSFVADDHQTVVHSVNIGKPLVETQP